MGRAPCCDKSNVKRGPWSPEEDAILKSFIEQNGTGGNWIALPQKIGLKRCGKSCRLRWLNYLRPDIKHGGFSEEEDSIICSLYLSIGSRWSIIAAQLPGRTDNDIKNYWNTRLKKKLFSKRKEHQVCPVKQELNVVADLKRNDYYSESTMKMPYSYQDLPHDHISIRKFLISLGGRLFDNQQPNYSVKLQDPLDISTTRQLYSPPLANSENSINEFSSTSSTFPLNGCYQNLSVEKKYNVEPTYTNLLPNSSGLPFDLGNLVYSNSQGLDGFDCLYEEELINRIHSRGAKRNVWVDESSTGSFASMHPNLVSNCESYQQGTMQERVFKSENHASQ